MAEIKEDIVYRFLFQIGSIRRKVAQDHSVAQGHCFYSRLVRLEGGLNIITGLNRRRVSIPDWFD